MDSYTRDRILHTARSNPSMSHESIAGMCGVGAAEVAAVLGGGGGGLFNPGAGQIGLDFNGDLDMGLGGGLGVDLSNGDLTFDGFDL